MQFKEVAMQVKEDIQYLEDWLRDAEKLARKIHEKSRPEGKLSIFTISSTTKPSTNYYPYLTPIRRITHGFIGGAVVFSQTQAVLLCQKIDGMVDYILVDAEKKIGISANVDLTPLKEFKLPPIIKRRKSRFLVEMGNLSAACYPRIAKSHFCEYKPNDLTAEAVWHFLSNHFRILSGRKATIIGAGNIGFKLALKLVECGVDVNLVRRDLNKGMMIANTINILKPASTIARAYYNQDPLQASLFSDALIGCAEGIPIINWEMIQSLSKDGIVIDVGKGTIHKDAIYKAREFNIPMFRTDISSALDGLMATILRNQKVIKSEIGRREITEGIFVVSGGFIGYENDVVVDNCYEPRHIVGLCDGCGDFKKILSPQEGDILLKAKQIIGEKIID